MTLTPGHYWVAIYGVNNTGYKGTFTWAGGASGSLPDAAYSYDLGSSWLAGTDFNLAFRIIGEGSDTIAPVVTVPSNMTFPATDASGSTVPFSASAYDIVDGTFAPSCVPVSGSLFPLGSTPVTCTATDTAGNFDDASFTVTVTDQMNPIVTVPINITEASSDPSGKVVTFSATADDNVDGPITPTCVPASGDTFVIGTTPVTCTAKDTAGNNGSASFNVTVTYVEPVPLSQITTARATCSQFTSSTPPTLPWLQYVLTTSRKTGDTTIKSVTPSSFAYFVNLTDSTNGTLEISQGNDMGFPDITPQTTKIVLYNANCENVTRTWTGTATLTNHVLTITNIPAEATFVKVPYSAKSVYGHVVGTLLPSVSYTFSAAIGSEPAFTTAILSLENKP
ncbi:MAG TPA: HYR domain-containing protein [Anaerolineaceae bacterium]|nr:HYR domain-containing protein [Anaerolineaceae bacterium]